MSGTDLQLAFQAFDERNAGDPKTTSWQGQQQPRGLVYGRRMSEWLARLVPDASRELQLAVRAQHLARHEMPRSDYPEGRTGYLEWRKQCMVRHAEIAVAILEELGFAPETGVRVADLIQKKAIKRDAEAQALEDVACLVFLEDHFADFAKQHDEDKLVNILRKTWRKMSDAGHAAAQQIDLAPELGELVQKALADD